MKIIISSHGGFCYGVRRAYDMVKDVLGKGNKNIYIIGELIHNSFVVKELEELGIIRINYINEIKDNWLRKRHRGVSILLTQLVHS